MARKQDRETARAMYAEGANYKEIGDALSATKSTISYWCGDLAKARLVSKMANTAERKAISRAKKAAYREENAKGKLCQFPYLGYKMYVHGGKDGRKRCHLIRISGGHRTCVQLAKYVLEVHIGRRLVEGETVDHIDEDKTNDEVGNLQILTQVENSKKHALFKNPNLDNPRFCSWCEEEFVHKNRRRETCSDPCRRQLMSAIISNYHGSRIR